MPSPEPSFVRVIRLSTIRVKRPVRLKEMYFFFRKLLSGGGGKNLKDRQATCR
jgi:hypothetical protein